MTRLTQSPRVARRFLARFRRDQNGASIVEFSLVLGLFLLLFFALIDFGRLAYNYVLAEKAIQMAARTAAVRPPICPGVPAFNARPATGVPTPAPTFGTSCSLSSGVCNPVSVTCLASAATAGASLDTMDEIWNRIGRLLPNGVTRDNLRVSYTYDSIGFLGGPYVPILSVALENVEFEFVSPLGALAGLASGGATASNLGQQPIAFPTISAALPAEDLRVGG